MNNPNITWIAVVRKFPPKDASPVGQFTVINIIYLRCELWELNFMLPNIKSISIAINWENKVLLAGAWYGPALGYWTEGCAKVTGVS